MTPKKSFQINAKVQAILDDYRSNRLTAEEARSKLHVLYHTYFLRRENR